jgi:DNA-binding Lrp family transcriptional regulator
LDHASAVLAPQVDDRDRAVLKAFADDAEATLAFQGIRRSLNLHPEKLSRALRRLEEAGVIARTKDGYRLTEAGVREIPAVERPKVERLTVMDTMVPVSASVESVVEQLKLKWFSNLRWVGFTAHGGVAALRWVTEDGRKRVTATLNEGRLLIDVEGELTDGVRDAIAGAQAIFAHIIRAATRAPAAADAPEAWGPEGLVQT